MKKFVSILVMLLGFVAVYAQNPVVFKSEIEGYNKTCPKTINDGLVLKNVVAEDNAVVFNYDVTDDVFASLGGVSDILHDAFVAELISSSDPLSQSLVAKCKKNKVSVIQRFTNPAGTVFDILISPADLD